MELTDAGFDASRLRAAYDLLDEAHAAGRLPGASLLVTRGEQPMGSHRVARKYFDRDDPVDADTVFLTASVSKPVTVAAAMLLVERGKIGLDQQACEILPAFGNRGKETILVRHMMTHTSGLPDMLPDNEQLRRDHQPLSEFVRRMCELELLFDPGTQISYQSCGTAILGAIVEEIEGVPLLTFLEREVFEPLGMHSTSLGVRDDLIPRIAHVNVSTDGLESDWGRNTPYWWGFGAPWGGMFSTVDDIWARMARARLLYANRPHRSKESQGAAEDAYNCRTRGKIPQVGHAAPNHADEASQQPAKREARSERGGEQGRRDGGHDEKAEDEQHPSDAHRSRHNHAEHRVKGEVPGPYVVPTPRGLVGIV